MEAASVVVLPVKEEKVLLQLRDEHAPTDPGEWAFFGGGMEEDESPKEAVRREAFEEIRLRVEDPSLFCERRQPHPYFPTEYVFIVEVKEEDIQGLELHEGRDMDWFSVDDLPGLDMAEHKKLVFRLAMNYFENEL
jgi:8-oxo-dGTP diphosphatase